LRNSNSNGGGHVQTANKGGTGQTTYNKGDILVATSASVLSKLAISSTLGDVLQVDASQATGMKWGGTVANKIVAKSSIVSADGGLSSIVTSLLYTTVPGSTLGVTNAIRYTGYIHNLRTTTSDFVLGISYGNNQFFTTTFNALANANRYSGAIEGMLVGNNSSVAQAGYVKMYLSNSVLGGTTGNVIYVSSLVTSSVNSASDQVLSITGQFSGGTPANNSVMGGLFVVEKIS
jgi:hypothetical protein